MKIRAVNDSKRVRPDVAATVPDLRKNPEVEYYILPSGLESTGFRISIPSLSRLAELEHKNSLATMIESQDSDTGSQTLSQQDQNAIASNATVGVLRLIGSPWLDFLDCSNIRCQKREDGHWTIMLSAMLG
jgi:hypothetical protein